MTNTHHCTHVIGLGEGIAQAVCDCGWGSERYGSNKQQGTMDALEHAKDAADLHEWEFSLGERGSGSAF
jgi:hypothetical protein